MATRVYPDELPSTSSSNYITTRRENFTLWMKSLLFHGNGCTVFDSNGLIVYRIDNYDGKRSGEVLLMDLRGNVLYSLQHKKQLLFGCWVGNKWSDSKVRVETPRFRVRTIKKTLRGNMTCHVSMGCGGAGAIPSCYKVAGAAGKSALQITDNHDRVVAEVKQKKSSSGVALGSDVLTLVVEPQTDHSLIMALVTVYALINHKL